MSSNEQEALRNFRWARGNTDDSRNPNNAAESQSSWSRWTSLAGSYVPLRSNERTNEEEAYFALSRWERYALPDFLGVGQAVSYGRVVLNFDTGCSDLGLVCWGRQPVFLLRSLAFPFWHFVLLNLPWHLGGYFPHLGNVVTKYTTVLGPYLSCLGELESSHYYCCISLSFSKIGSLFFPGRWRT